MLSNKKSLDVDISIVIPTYNAENFIGKTLLNILQSSLKSFEVICVDDCSKDRTQSIIQSYSKLDKRIRLIKLKKNFGNPSLALKTATPFCQGKYFFYMSHDDFISPDLLSEMMKVAKKENADVVVPEMLFYKSPNTEIDSINPEKYFNKPFVFGKECFFAIFINKCHGFVLRKTSLLKKYPFDGKYYDSTDICTQFQVYAARKVCFSKGIFYYNVSRDDSITKNIKVIAILKSKLDVLNFIINGSFSKFEKVKARRAFLNLYKFFYKMGYKKKIVSDSFFISLSEAMYAYKNLLRKNHLLFSLGFTNIYLLYMFLKKIMRQISCLNKH